MMITAKEDEKGILEIPKCVIYQGKTRAVFVHTEVIMDTSGKRIIVFTDLNNKAETREDKNYRGLTEEQFLAEFNMIEK